MARRTSRSDIPKDVPAVIRGLAACRGLMIEVQRQVKPSGACFYGAAMVLAALDSFAAFLTGQRYYLATLEDRGFIVPEPVAIHGMLSITEFVIWSRDYTLTGILFVNQPKVNDVASCETKV